MPPATAQQCARRAQPLHAQGLHSCSAGLTAPSPPRSRPWLQIYATADFPQFGQALAAFLKIPEVAASEPQSAAIAVAGPVARGRCVMTNLGWVIDAGEVQAEFGFRCGACKRGCGWCGAGLMLWGTGLRTAPAWGRQLFLLYKRHLPRESLSLGYLCSLIQD